MSHHEPAANPTANDRRHTTRSLVAHAVTFASIVLASLAPGLASSRTGQRGRRHQCVRRRRATPAGGHAIRTVRVRARRRVHDARGGRRTVRHPRRDHRRGRHGHVDERRRRRVRHRLPGRHARAHSTSTLNPRARFDLANSAIVVVGDDGAIDVRSTLRIDTAIDLIVDVTGVFVPDDSSRAGRFVAVAPTRISDSRTPGAPATGVAPGTSISLPLPSGVAADATAIAINVTTVGGLRTGFLSVRPAGLESTTTSFMNPDGSGRARAAVGHRPRVARRLRHHHHCGRTRDRRPRRMVHRSVRVRLRQRAVRGDRHRPGSSTRDPTRRACGRTEHASSTSTSTRPRSPPT